MGCSLWLFGFLSSVVLSSAGSISTTEAPPFTSPPLGNLSDVRYFLWTRSNPSNEDYYSLDPSDLSELSSSPFEDDLPTIFMYHGYGSHPPLVKWITDTKDELLLMMSANVFSVDWSMLVPDHHFPEAIQNVYQVGNLTATLIDNLNYLTRHSPSQVHIIGHSLGAHAAGMSGKYVTSGKVARVTGLDPAGPGFYDAPSDRRLDSSDADFVDVIHTNSGPILDGCYGLSKAVGDVDFYPNGGRHQPGCVPLQPGGDIIDYIEDCSHDRVVDYWVESLSALQSNPTFTSWPCDSWDDFSNGMCQTCGQGCLDMGYHVTQGLQGSYYLQTAEDPPYALGDHQ
ncbi:unnamed protein product, partial [Meganyctiphanes norvegica]